MSSVRCDFSEKHSRQSLRGGLIFMTAGVLCFSLATSQGQTIPASGLSSQSTAAQNEGEHPRHVSANKREGVVSVDVIEQGGRVHLLVLRNETSVQKLLYSFSIDGGRSWSKERQIPIPDGAAAQVSRGADARIAKVGVTLVAMWMSHVDNALYGAGPMVVMRSLDEGKTWTEGASAADWLRGPHGYMALSATAGKLHATWLDSREGPSSIPGSQGLRYAASEDGGASWSNNITLDVAACACCWTTSRADKSGNVYVLYRDKQPSDMAIGVIDAKSHRWARLATVGAFNWEFSGCPHIGGALTLLENGNTSEFHVLVGTRKNTEAGVYHLVSKDGRTWANPERLGDETATHGDIAARKDGSVMAVWDMVDPEAHDGSVAIYFSSLLASGWSLPERISTQLSSASHPRIVPTSDGFLVLWTEIGSNGSQELVFKRFASFQKR